MEKEAMAGHVMVPLQSLSLELPDAEIVVGYNKDTSALQGRKKKQISPVVNRLLK